MSLGISLRLAGRRVMEIGMRFTNEANTTVVFTDPKSTITKTVATNAYDARAQSNTIMPLNFLARARTLTDDAQFALGWGSDAVTGTAGFEWYVEVDTTNWYFNSFGKGAAGPTAHGLTDSTGLRVWIRRLNGVWTGWTGTSDDFAAATLRITYTDAAIDNDAWYATLLIYTASAGVEVAVVSL